MSSDACVHYQRHVRSEMKPPRCIQRWDRKFNPALCLHSCACSTLHHHRARVNPWHKAPGVICCHRTLCNRTDMLFSSCLTSGLCMSQVHVADSHDQRHRHVDGVPARQRRGGSIPAAESHCAARTGRKLSQPQCTSFFLCLCAADICMTPAVTCSAETSVSISPQG